MSNQEFINTINNSASFSQSSHNEILNMEKHLKTNLVAVPKGGKVYHENRAKKTSENLKDILENKFLCHIGCHTGVVTQEFSKVCSKILAIDIEESSIEETSQRTYDCPVDIKKIDAIKHLEENPDVNPEVFYLWMNYKAMEPWIDKIMDVRGHTNPTIILGIGLQKVVSPVENGEPLQLVEAKRIKEKYNGNIRLASFPIADFTRRNQGVFGLLILKGLK
jgi:hypothetical protein